MNRIDRLLRNIYLKPIYGNKIQFPKKIWSVKIRSGFELMQFPGKDANLVLELGDQIVIEKNVWIKGKAGSLSVKDP